MTTQVVVPNRYRQRTRYWASKAFVILSATLCSARSSEAQVVTTTALTLRDLLTDVRVRHPLMRSAQEQLRAAQASRVTAGLFTNPMFQYQIENAPLPGRSSPEMDREVMATVMLPLEPLYQRGSRLRQADAEIRASRAAVSVAEQQLTLDAAHAYYEVGLAQVTADAARDVISWLDTLVAYNRVRVEEGIAAEADLLRSELERDRASADLAVQEAELARARAGLLAFVDSGLARRFEWSSPTAIRIAVQSTPLAMPDIVKVNLAESASQSSLISTIASRPQVQLARERLAVSEAGVGIERSMLLRELGATLGTKNTAGSRSLVAGLSLPLPLLNQNRGEVARASAQRDAAKFDLEAEQRRALSELVGAVDAARLLTVAASRLAQPGRTGSPNYLDRADETRRIALGAYTEGAVPLLSVLDAARTWAEARVAYYRAIFAQHEAILTLLAATGADISNAFPDQPRGGHEQ